MWMCRRMFTPSPFKLSGAASILGRYRQSWSANKTHVSMAAVSLAHRFHITLAAFPSGLRTIGEAPATPGHDSRIHGFGWDTNATCDNSMPKEEMPSGAAGR
ncbi:hypothetical protein GQ53DRAFT_137675 [Thozetella sp. PMI_491]|nr:hypothetical protein GQ53DRAFT_137675 [Thozetella sp. PMI_491]